MRERFRVALGREQPADSVLHCLGDPAVICRDDGQPGRHRFEHGIGDAFLVAVETQFAGVEKEVRLGVESAQLILREEPGKRDARGDADRFHQCLQLRQLGPFAGDGEGRE